MLQLRKILLCNKYYYLLLIIVIIVTIIRLIIPKTSNYNSTSKSFTGTITNIIYKENTIELYIKNKETIIGRIKEDSSLQLGDQVKLTGDFYKIPKNTTKYLFNYQKYCYRRNIFYNVEIKEIKRIKKNHNIIFFLKNKIKERTNHNPYLNTFLLGDKNDITKEVKESYQENGISHLFAISGMHITLLSSLIEKLLKELKRKEEEIFKITSIFLLFYLILLGISPSILRGVLFYIAFSINRIYYFYIDKKNLFILLLSISLLINPNFIFDVGFLYSYLISFSLIMKEDIKSNHYFISLLKCSCLSFLVSIPISLYSFYQINIMSILYNLLFVPFISFFLFPFSLIVVVIKPLEPIYIFFTNIMEKTSLFLGKISFGKILFKRVSFFVYVFYFLLILIYLIKDKEILKKIFLLFLVIHKLIPILFSPTYVEFFDVSQGDSILIQNKHKTILIDTGGVKNSSKNIIVPSLKATAINKINFLVLTHGDFDHMGEAINLVENFKVDKVIFNCGPYNDLEQDLIKVLDKKKIKYYSCIKELNIDNNKLSFLQTKEYDNENDNSNVIYTELNGYKFMFMGDAGVEKENDMLDKYKLPDIDVLKVGHHGSKTSSSKDFINEINPKYSVISVGKNNRYGHPNKEVLDNLENSKIYRTDEDGSIMFKIKNNRLKIETCGP